MSTERSSAESAGWNGKTTPDGEGGVTDESGSDGSRLPGALRATLGRVISAIRAFGATLPAQAEKPKSDAPRFGAYEQVEGAKYYPPAPPSMASDGDLPDWSGRPGVTLMAVDPYLVHAYWDFDLAKLPPETAGVVLRFYDAATHFDVDVDLRTRNWYVPLWSPAKTYCADLAAITAAGEFIPLARSNTIQTPRAWPVADVEQRVELNAEALEQSGEPVPPQTAPLAPEPAGTLEITLRTDGTPRAPEPPAAEAEPAVWLAAPASSEQHSSNPPGAAEILRRRLSEIYEFRQWQPRSQGAEAESSSATPPLPATQNPPDDLTAHAEREFSPGLSSLLLEAQDPTKRAG